MKRRVLITLLILIAVAGIAIFVFQSLQERLPSQAQAALDRYVTSENGVAAQTVIVWKVIHASRPGRFTPASSAASVGSSLHFRRTRDYRGGTTPNPLITTKSPFPGTTIAFG